MDYYFAKLKHVLAQYCVVGIDYLKKLIQIDRPTGHTMVHSFDEFEVLERVCEDEWLEYFNRKTEQPWEDKPETPNKA